MTDPLRPMISLVEAIVRSNNSTGSRTDSHLQAEAATAASTSRQFRTNRTSKTTVQQRLKSKLQQIDASDHKQLRRAFIEFSILNEFGEQLSLDYNFVALVEQVNATMDMDAGITDELDKTINTLINSTTSGL